MKLSCTNNFLIIKKSTSRFADFILYYLFVISNRFFCEFITAKFLFFYPIIIPAIVADIKEAIVPPIKALIPNLDKFLRCPGAKEPIPPI